MKRWLDPYSSVLDKLALIMDLIILNICFLLSSVLLFTVGAALSAMYCTAYKLNDRSVNSVCKTFFAAFWDNLKRSTLVWIGVVLAGALVAVDILYIMQHCIPLYHPLGLAMLLVALLLGIVLTYAFPILARFDCPLKNLLSTCFPLFVLHLPTSLAAIAVNCLPLLLLWFVPRLFIQLGIVWVLLGFSTAAYINGKMFLKVFAKHGT